MAATRGNHKCGVGIAYQAGIGGVKIIGGGVTDQMEASALGYRHDLVDVYSNSWGPNDGNTVEGPGPLGLEALAEGTERGRGGLGSIFVWASGNGGSSDDCNCDGYANSIYTIAIGAVQANDERPYYSEWCAAGLAVTYSSGSGQSITTVDWHNGCSDRHGGTSAAAPNAAGVLALVLQANGNKATWRDVQHIIVHGARKIDPANSDWTTNGAGLHVHHAFGFGVLDAASTIAVARTWVNVGPHLTTTFGPLTVDAPIPSNTVASLEALVAAKDTGIRKLEHVQVRLTTTRGVVRGALHITLVAPSGTQSRLLALRSNDRTTAGFDDWTFMTVRHWDEDPFGVWRLEIGTNSGSSGASRLVSWNLILHGHNGGQGGPMHCLDSEYLDAAQNLCIKCHAECVGCTGASNLECRTCAHDIYGPSCVASCTELGLYTTPNRTCISCHAQCVRASGCTSELARGCVACAGFQSNLDCVASCPPLNFVSADIT